MSNLAGTFGFAALVCFGLSGQSFAHAELTLATPAEGETVATSPAELDLEFSEDLNLKFSGVTVTGPKNAAVQTGEVRLIDGDTTLVVPIAGVLGAGTYTVAWRSRPQDTRKLHLHGGAIVSPDAALAICRFLHDVSAMLVWGASAYLVTLVPRNLAQDVGRRFRSFGVLAVAVVVATTVAAIPLESAVIGEGWNDALDLTTIRAVLFETSVGSALQVQAMAALVLTLTLAIPLRSRQLATALASGVVLAAVSLTGHAAMQESWLGVAHRANDAVHVLSAGAWLGGLSRCHPSSRCSTTRSDDPRPAQPYTDFPRRGMSLWLWS